MAQSKSKMKEITYTSLKKSAVIFLALPLAAFTIGFLKWYWAIPAFSAIIYTICKVFRDSKQTRIAERSISISVFALFGLFGFMLIWTFLGGMNGYWFQTSDWGARNAVFRDLITHTWPVYFQSGSALVYYLGFWLPAAAIGKLVFILSNSLEAAWFVGRMALWVWSSVGLSIISLLLFVYLGAEKNRTRWMVLLLFVFFSGMDIIGVFLGKKQGLLLSPEVLHLEWWGPNAYQFSSITTCLYWVFNQAIIPWMITLLVMLDDDARLDVFYLAAGMLCAPMPTVGLFVLMAGQEAVHMISSIRERKAKEWVSKVFSLSNLLVLICCVPILAFYLLGSNAAGDIGYKAAEKASDSTFVLIAKYAIFIILDAGVLLFLLWPFYNRNIQFYVVGISLLVFPLIQVGTKSDFCMRASIPSIFVLMVCTMDVLANKRIQLKQLHKERTRQEKLQRLCIPLLCITLAIGAVTPAVEIYRGFYNVLTKRSIHLSDDTIYSFETIPNEYNYTARDPEKLIFFRVFAGGGKTDE